MYSSYGEHPKDLSSQSASSVSLAKSSRTKNQPKSTKDISSLSSSSVPKESITPLKVGTPKIARTAKVSTDDILKERGSRYGEFISHADITQALKETIREHMFERWSDLDADQQEALDMICHKIGRIANGDPDYSDSWHDIAGYAKLVADRLDG